MQFAALGTDGLKSILITSSNPTEDKTTTAINLATSIAREGASTVLLADADLRRPNLHTVLNKVAPRAENGQPVRASSITPAERLPAVREAAED